MLKSDRIGLVIVIASLIAIAAIVFLVFRYQNDDRIADIRSEGLSLTRVLSGIPYRQLIPGGAQQGVMQVLRHSTRNDDFAYLSIVGRDARPVTEIAANGVLVPAAAVPNEPTAWLGESRLTLPTDGREVVQFHAPLFEEGSLQGFVRLAYFVPASGILLAQLPFLAMVSLPVFLLVPLFYLLLRREIRPIAEANQEISNLMEGESFRRLEIAATGELGDFMRRFNGYIEQAGARMKALEQDQQRLITSSKLLTYKKNRVETVLETLPEAVMILDETGAVSFANRKLAALFDVSPEVILSQPPPQWCDNPDILQLLARYQTAGKTRHYTDTIRFNLANVADKAIATKSYPLFSPRSPTDSIGTLIIFRDETQEALARQARADFVAHLSHELKSPLNVLAMYSESLLGEPGKSDDFRVEAANVIAEEVDRLNTLVTGLLNMTQIENGSLAADRSLVKLRDVAAAAFEEAQHSAMDKDCRFVLDVPKEMNPVFVDKGLIRIAITNLLSNAVKYNLPGGEVRLVIEETEDAVQIRVIDSGIGISEAEEARIFDKFYRSADPRVQNISGHGLGLALTKQIVELHHGTLSLDHDRKQGAEFIINLWKEATAVRQAI